MLAATAVPTHGAELAAKMRRLPWFSGTIALGIDGFRPDDEGGVVTLDGHRRPKLTYDVSPAKVAFMTWDDIAALMENTAIIRHLGKIRATHHNALALVELEKEFGSVGAYIADWPASDMIGLYADIKKRFKQLGGNSGPYFVRMMGKDGFILTNDVVAALNKLGVASGKLTAKKDQAAVQAAFNAWHEESSAPYAHISRTLAIWTG